MENVSLFDFMTEEDQKKYKRKKSTDWKWTFADYPKEKNGIKVFSCFACGGGSTMGYKLAGCEVVGCLEIDPKMNEIYVKNHHPKHNFCMDIRDFNKIPDADLPEELFDLDVLDGSPPCTTFSMAGDREDSWGKKKKFREGQAEQTLDDLAFVFIETVKKLKPKIVIMENVEGLILGEAFSYVRRIYTDFKNAGYKVHHWLLKGERMGIPQTRHRVFFVAVREDINVDPMMIDMGFDYEPVLFGDVKEGIGNEPNEKLAIFKWLKLSEPRDVKLSNVVVRHNEPEKFWTHWLLQDNNIACTITARGDMYRGNEKTYLSYEDIRNISTFPLDYDFGKTTRTHVQFICGMSVPPVMMKRIVQRLIEQGVFDYKKCFTEGEKK